MNGARRYKYTSPLGPSRRAWLPGAGWVSPGALVDLTDADVARACLGAGDVLVLLDAPDSGAAREVSEPPPAAAEAAPAPVEPEPSTEAPVAPVAPSDAAPGDTGEAPRRRRRRR